MSHQNNDTCQNNVQEQFKEPQQCFNNAIAKGNLTLKPSDDNYAGNYMYMHSEGNNDYFKNIITRKYDVVSLNLGGKLRAV